MTGMDMLRRPLAEYLVHKFGPEAELLGSERFPRGSSRETWFIEYRARADAPITKVVFRSDLPSGSTIPSSLEQEYFMYERLGHTDVPIAKVLWWEDDPAWAARAFYVREHIEGSWSVPNYSDPDPAYDALRVETAREHVRNLAVLHQVDWKKTGFDTRLPAPPDEASAGRAYIDQIVAQMEEFQLEPVPLFVAGAAWLKERAPTPPRVVLCKGTNGLGEEVFRDGKLVAMSDWEEAAIGDPAIDFAFCQNFMLDIDRDGETLWSLQHALDYYYELSGIRVSAQAVGYYKIVHALRIVLFSHRAAVGVHSTADATIRQAWTGTEALYIGRRVLAGAMGLSPMPPATRFDELNKTIGQS